MVPPRILPNQVRSLFPFSTALHRHSRSKAQTCLFKILHIISVFSAENVSEKQCLSVHEENPNSRGFDVDLNISLRPLTEIEPVKPPLMADGGVNCENCVPVKNDMRKGESESNDVEQPLELAVEEERTTVESEISHVGDQSSGIDYDGAFEEENPRDEGCLGLLIEAAQLILCESESKSSSHKTEPPINNYVESSAAVVVCGTGTKRKQQCWSAEFESTSPVLKSKRGRNLVLPEKYRDSVVEPLVRWTPLGHGHSHRSNSHADRVISKRRSK